MRFTLIELLVVVSIIAILSAMLLPVLSRARTTATRVLCGANQRQVTMALLQYLDDNNGVQPAHSWSYAWTDKPSTETYMGSYYFAVTAEYVGVPIEPETYSAIDGANASMYYGYVKHMGPGGKVRKSVFFCPADPFYWSEQEYANIQAEGANPHSFPVPTTYAAAGYAWHAASTKSDFGWCTDKDIDRKSLSNERDPANAPLYSHISNGYTFSTCSGRYGFDEWGWAAYSYWQESESNSEATGSHTWGGNHHDRVLPFSYVDGHMEYISAGRMANPAQHGPGGAQPLWNSRLWNRPQGSR